jgi:ADP-ribosyl-[dinitrogen reductase] hydrolase
MLGAIIGDIVGSVYEKRNYRAKDFEPLFHPNARFTDDTVCTIAVADALLHGKKPTQALQEWCRRYEDTGGWGQRFALWIADNEPKPYQSWGNGAAMRISAVGLLARTEQEAVDWADYFTVVTHDQADAIAAARAVSLAIYWARHDVDSCEIANRLTKRFGYNLEQTPNEIRPTYKHTETSAGSVPQAIVCALQSTSYEDALRNAVSIGGDSDTIAAIAGSIAEALHGIPSVIAVKGVMFLPLEMKKIIEDFYEISNLSLDGL